jgi:hypothetical protein
MFTFTVVLAMRRVHVSDGSSVKGPGWEPEGSVFVFA